MTSTEYLHQQCQVWFFFWVPTPSCWSRRAWSFTTFAKLKQSFFQWNGDGTFPVLVSVSRVERMKGFEFYRFQFATGIFQTKLLVSIDSLWMSLVQLFVSHLPAHLLSFSDTSRSSRSTDTNHYQQQHDYTYLFRKGANKKTLSCNIFCKSGDFLVFPEILQSTQPDWENKFCHSLTATSNSRICRKFSLESSCFDSFWGSRNAVAAASFSILSWANKFPGPKAWGQTLPRNTPKSCLGNQLR